MRLAVFCIDYLSIFDKYYFSSTTLTAEDSEKKKTFAKTHSIVSQGRDSKK